MRKCAQQRGPGPNALMRPPLRGARSGASGESTPERRPSSFVDAVRCTIAPRQFPLCALCPPPPLIAPLSPSTLRFCVPFPLLLLSSSFCASLLVVTARPRTHFSLFQRRMIVPAVLLASALATCSFSSLSFSFKKNFECFLVVCLKAYQLQLTMTSVFSLADCQKHRDRDDCWLIIDGKVYDVSEFLEEHPGGDEVILSATGKDATDDFEDVGHSDGARELMKRYLIGDMDVSTLPVKQSYENTPRISERNPSEMLVTLLQFLIPLTFLALAIAVRYLTDDTKSM